MVSTRSKKRLANTPTMTTDFSLTEDFFRDVETNDAASALTYLRVLNDINESPDYPEAMKYLKRVQAESNSREYITFIGVLKEFQEDVVREIDAKKDYVIKCALTLFQGQTDLLLGLGDYIPEILDTLEPDQPEQDHHHKPLHDQPTTQHNTAMEWSDHQEWQQVPIKHTVRPLQGNPTIESDWQQLQKEAPLQWQQQIQARGEEVYNAFMLKVQKRFLHSDHTTYMKIYVTMHEWLVDMTMDVHKAKEDMAALLQGHNDLWKEFEQFIPPELRAGSSSEPGAANP